MILQLPDYDPSIAEEFGYEVASGATFLGVPVFESTSLLAQLCDFTGKYRSGVQERERSCRCGVGKVIGGDVYGLYRGD